MKPDAGGRPSAFEAIQVVAAHTDQGSLPEFSSLVRHRAPVLQPETIQSAPTMSTGATTGTTATAGSTDEASTGGSGEARE